MTATLLTTLKHHWASYTTIAILGVYLAAVGIPASNWRYWPIMALTLAYGFFCNQEASHD